MHAHPRSAGRRARPPLAPALPPVPHPRPGALLTAAMIHMSTQRLHKFAKVAGELVFPNFDQGVQSVLEAAARRDAG